MKISSQVEIAYQSAEELKRSCGMLDSESPNLAELDMAIAEATSTLRTLKSIRKKVVKRK